MVTILRKECYELTKSINNPTETNKLTRGTIDLIRSSIRETGSANRYVLLEHICKKLEEKHQKNNLEYQTKRMKLDTTGKILDAIDEYFYKHYPKQP